MKIEGDRIQRDWLFLIYDSTINIEELQSIFNTKGLIKINAFLKKNTNELHVFVVFDKTRDFFLENTTNSFKELVKPIYFWLFNKKVFVGNGPDTEFQSSLNKHNKSDEYEKLYKFTEKDGLYDLTVWDRNYFFSLSRENIESKNSESLKILISDLNFFTNIVKEEISSIKKVYNILNEIKAKTDFIEIPQLPTNNIKEQNIQNFFYDTKNNELPIDENILSKSVENELTSILDNNIKEKNFLEKFTNLDFQVSKDFVQKYLKDNNINDNKLRNSKSDSLKIITIYYGLKSFPKKSHSNKWIKNIKNELPTPIFDMLKKKEII